MLRYAPELYIRATFSLSSTRTQNNDTHGGYRTQTEANMGLQLPAYYPATRFGVSLRMLFAHEIHSETWRMNACQYLVGAPFASGLCMFGDIGIWCDPDHDVRAAKLTHELIHMSGARSFKPRGTRSHQDRSGGRRPQRPVIDGRLYVCGGNSVNGGKSANLACFDPSLGVWQTLPPMSQARWKSAAAVLGARAVRLRRPEPIPPRHDRMLRHGEQHVEFTSNHASFTLSGRVAVIRGHVYVVGGAEGFFDSSAERLRPAGNGQTLPNIERWKKGFLDRSCRRQALRLWWAW